MNRLSGSSSGYLAGSKYSSESESSEQSLAGAVESQRNQKALTGTTRSVSTILTDGFSQLSVNVQAPEENIPPQIRQRAFNKSKPTCNLHIYPRDKPKCTEDMIKESAQLLVEQQIFAEQPLKVKET